MEFLSKIQGGRPKKTSNNQKKLYLCFIRGCARHKNRDNKMKKLALCFMTVTMLVTVSACKRDVYGDIFINRDPVTFYVHSDEGQPLENVSLKTEELDGFDYDLIVDGTYYAYTDSLGMVTVDAARSNPDLLAERTTRFTFTATGYEVFDTIFNNWDDTVDIVLKK